MMPAVASPPSLSRSTTTTFAPDFAKASAVARPMPFPAPVISATLPVKSISIASSLLAQPARSAGDYLRPHLCLHKLPAQCASRTLAGRFSLRPYRASVDKDMLDARGRQGRLGEGRAVDHGLGIEHAEIGIGARPHDAAPGQAEPSRRQ